MFLNLVESNVLIVGDIMLDRYWYGSTTKISPESPVPVVKINKVMNTPGGAANVAMNVAALGVQSKLIGLVGIDEASQILKRKLTDSKVNWDFVSSCTHPTIIKLRVVSRNQQLIRLDFEKGFNDVDTTRLINQVKLCLPKYKVLVLSDYAKGSLSRIEEIIQSARCINIPIIIDPKGTQFSKYKGATLLTPNMLEFESVVGTCDNEDILIRRAKEIIGDYNLSALLITRSEKGMILLQQNVDPLYFETHSKKVYDVTGAGDTVVGVLSAALSSGKTLEQACFLANAAAGVVIEKFGTSTADIIEIRNIIQEYEFSKMGFGVLDENTLKKYVILARSRGEKIVMTNGVFDVLHYGHISYLTDAKKLGDRLIVAVSNNKPDHHLKGVQKSINTLEKRMFVLASLSMIDWVVPFYEDTPTRLISEVSPDFLVKGSDNKIDDVNGKENVLRKDGKVCVLDFKTGCSSSKIINFVKHKKS